MTDWNNKEEVEQYLEQGDMKYPIKDIKEGVEFVIDDEVK